MTPHDHLKKINYFMVVTPSSFFLYYLVNLFFLSFFVKYLSVSMVLKMPHFLCSFSFLAGFSISPTRDSFSLTSLLYFAIFSSPPLNSSPFPYTNIHYIMNNILESVQSFSFVLLFFMFLEFQREEIWWLFHQKPNSG